MAISVTPFAQVYEHSGPVLRSAGAFPGLMVDVDSRSSTDLARPELVIDHPVRTASVRLPLMRRIP
jgi:hypothetical protein